MSLKITVALVCLLIPFAAAQGSVSVALVNVEQVLSEAVPVRAAIEAVDIEVAARQRHIAQREEELGAMIETYRTQSSLWSEDVRSQQQREIIERNLELEDLERDLRDLIDERETSVIVPTFDKITQAIRQIAEENDIDLVLRSDVAVFAAEDLNLTEEVINILNEMTSDELNLPQAPEESQ